jgi:Kef-type K+ transport system membrane component KefB
MQLVIFAMAVAVILVFFVGIYPLSYPWRRGLAITVILIAVAFFVLASMIRDRFRRRDRFG